MKKNTQQLAHRLSTCCHVRLPKHSQSTGPSREEKKPWAPCHCSPDTEDRHRDNLAPYQLLSSKRRPSSNAGIYPEMTRSLISLARHALPALLCPWKATKQPNPSQGGIERQERGEGEWGKNPSFPVDRGCKPTTINSVTLNPTETNPRLSARGVYASYCAVTALVAISKPGRTRKDAMGSLSTLVIPI